MIINVSPSININDILSYEFKGNEIKLGTRVLIPMRNRLETGWVVDKNNSYKGKVKQIFGVIKNSINYSMDFINFIKFLSEEMFIPFGILMDYTLLPDEKNIKSLFFDFDSKEYSLSKIRFKQLNSFANKKSIEFFFKKSCNIKSNIKIGDDYKNNLILSNEFDKDLIRFVDNEMRNNKRVLLITEDNLTADYYHDKIKESYLYNSNISSSKRKKIVCEISNKDSFVVIGGMLAVFLPLEFDSIVINNYNSYKYFLRYFKKLDYKSIAELRARFFSLRLYQFGITKSILNEDINISDKRSEVSIDVLRLKPKENAISEEFLNLLEKSLNEEKRILVLTSKKKSSHSLFCKKCKKYILCPKCGGDLEVKLDFSVNCKSCGYSSKELKKCPDCNEELLINKDFSADYFYKFLKKRFSLNNILLYDVNHKRVQSEVSLKSSNIIIAAHSSLNLYFDNDFDLIVYYKPEAIVSSDSINFGQAIYNTVNFLKRFVNKGGEIKIFSVFHFHYSLRFINSEEEYLNREDKYRKWFHLPPSYNLFNLVLRSKDLRKLAKFSRELCKKYKDLLIFKNIYLKSRKPYRGYYSIVQKIHIKPEDKGIIHEILSLSNYEIRISLN